MNNLAVFGGTSNESLVASVCESLGILVRNARISRFPDGEIIVKVEDDVRGNDCFVIQSTSPPINENLMELLIFVDCLKRASAKSITAVIPYFGYARQDRKAEGRTPITARMVADLLATVGINRVLTIDLHAKQIEGFFNIPVDHLTARPVFVKSLKSLSLQNTIVLSPDVGNMKIASNYAQELGMDIAVIDKRRINGEEVKMSTIVGDIVGKNILMFDDMISTAGTICAAAEFAKEKGCMGIKVVATHGLFCGSAIEKISKSPIDEIIISDTVPLNSFMLAEKRFVEENVSDFPKITIISLAKLLGEAIIRIYDRRSISVLLESGCDYSVRQMR